MIKRINCMSPSSPSELSAGLIISKSKEYISESEDEDAPPAVTTAGTSALSDAGEGSGVVSETGNGTGNDSGMEVDA
jgi:hypothetical protein